MYSEELEKTEKEYLENKKKIEDLTKKNFDLRRVILLEKFGIQKGTIVKRIKNGKLYRIDSICGISYKGDLGKPRIVAPARKKDGTYGVVNHMLFEDEWELADV